MSSQHSVPGIDQPRSRISEDKERSHYSSQEDKISNDVHNRAATAAAAAASPLGSIRSSRQDGDDDDQTVDPTTTKTSTTTMMMNNNNPPLPDEPPPSSTIDPVDDGWQPVWEETAQAYYFYNNYTGVTTWTNPRVPPEEATSTTTTTSAGIGNHDRIQLSPSGGMTEEEETKNHNNGLPRRPHGGYDPSIHGDYDPTAPYAQEAAMAAEEEDHNFSSGITTTAAAAGLDPMMYASTGTFNRFTGKWQASNVTPENFNDENKSRRQMSAFFDVDAAANRHDGKSLKAERAGKKLTKKELKAFKDKRREKKEEKRRAWLRD